MEELIKQLNEATKAYDEGHPIMSDKEWDDLYFQLQEWEKKSGIILPHSPTQKIIYQTVSRLEKVEHNHQMLSLDKTKHIEDVIDFIGNKEFLIMCKMDGLTCSLKYLDGKLISAETRGNGSIGENILHNAKVIPSIPFQIPYKGELIIDGEIICKYNDFETFKEEYKNPRNFAAGSIRLLSAKECGLRKLTFVAWDIIKGMEDNNNLFYKLQDLSEIGFEVVPSIFVKQDTARNYDNISALIDEIRKTADFYSYPIDGAVIKFNDINYGKSLGSTAHHFKNAIAYKFYDEVYETELLDIEWTMGRTGVLTPVAIFKPIDIDGSVVERASLHNISIMTDILGDIPHKFQKINVFKANMIIPQIESADRTKHGPLFYEQYPSLDIPDVCPICGQPTEIKNDVNTKFLICSNPACDGKLINRFDHFCGKKGLDIKGLSKATLEKLIDWGWISDLSDIYYLENYAINWKKKPGFGEKSVSNILNAISASKDCTLESFISAIGIPLIGRSMTKELLKHINSYEEFREKISEKFDFSEYQGFAGSKTDAILNFDYTEADKIYQILNIKNNIQDTVKNNNLNGITVVITGKLNNYKNRTELQSAIESIGGKVASSVSSKTNYLINNDINSNSSKNLSAKRLGVEIITEDDFVEKFFS